VCGIEYVRLLISLFRVCCFQFLTKILACSEFEKWLKAKDPSYGVRNLEDVMEEAQANGLEFVEKVEMPANNLSVIFRKK